MTLTNIAKLCSPLAVAALWVSVMAMCLLLMGSDAQAGDFSRVVDTTSDLNLTACTSSQGDCSLRGAINASGPNDLIHFNIPKSDGGYDPADDFWSIVLDSALPTIVDNNIVIDGYTQDAGNTPASPNTNGISQPSNAKIKIEIDGINVSEQWGIRVDSDGAEIKGLALGRFPGTAIVVLGSGNRISGNFIGTDVAGMVDRGNGDGVVLAGTGNQVGGSEPADRNVIAASEANGVAIVDSGNSVHGNFIGLGADGAALGNNIGVQIDAPGVNFVGGANPGERNVISANSIYGVELDAAAGSGNIVWGNYIGTTISGSAARGNGFHGIEVEADDTLIGGPGTGQGNLISGNGQHGVNVIASRTVISGNTIGTNAGGTSAIPNIGNGVQIGTGGPLLGTIEDNVVGGNTVGSRNLISGNSGHGIEITGGASSHAAIRGNYIGTNAAGNAMIPNDRGINVEGSSGNMIGGDGPGEGNVISGNNLQGIVLIDFGSDIPTDNVIAGNFIGVGANGSTPLGNAITGILVTAANDNTIGGMAQSAGNVIAYNGNRGIIVQGTAAVATTGNSILRNSIYSNTNIGIDLLQATNTGPISSGVDVNDPDDADNGPNGFQNYPALTGATTGSISIEGSFDSTPNTTFRFEFFINDQCDSSGYGEGEMFLGSANVNTDGDGEITFTANSDQNVAAGKYITATATNTTTGDTSEFSNCVQVEGDETPIPTATPTLTPTPTATTSPTPTPPGQTPTATPTPTLPGQTPTPTATPPVGELTQGDNDCDVDVDAVDALVSLQSNAGLPYQQQSDCIDIGAAIPAGIEPQFFGDIDCDGDVDAVDALQILRFVAGLPVNQEDGCTEIGQPL